ncbi:MAG: hypothetical protein GY756_09140 [bacterium]|nr:hypothetical protein [bacterium]
MLFIKKLLLSNYKKYIIFLFIFCISCSTVKNKSSYRQNIIETFKKGNVAKAKKNIEKETTQKVNSNEKLIWNLELGSFYFYIGDYTKSLFILTKTEEMIEKRHNNKLKTDEYDIKSKKIYPYNVTINDKIMLKIYQALDYFAMNNTDKGIKKIQLASKIQSKALVNFKNALKKENSGIRAQNKENRATVTFNSILSNKDIKKSYDNAYQNINIIYNDFSNPLLSYLSAIGYLYKDEYKHAYSELNKIYSVNDKNIYINRDLFTLARNINTTYPPELSNLKPYNYSLNNNIVFIIFARGFRPSLIEKKTELALPRIGYSRFLYPELLFHKCNINSLKIYTPENKSFYTESIADMDSIIAYEFIKKFPIHITKKAVLTVTKEKNANPENSMEEYTKGNIYGFLNMALIGLNKYALDEADIRCWETLPKDFQIAQLKMPKNGVLYIKPQGKDINTEKTKIELNPKNRITILYIRSISPENLTIKELKLN